MHFISNLGFYFSLLSSSHATPSPTPLLKLFPEHVFERERLELVPVALVELVLVLTQCRRRACRNADKLSMPISTPTVAAAQTAKPTIIATGEPLATDAMNTRSQNTAESCA